MRQSQIVSVRLDSGLVVVVVVDNHFDTHVFVAISLWHRGINEHGHWPEVVAIWYYQYDDVTCTVPVSIMYCPNQIQSILVLRSLDVWRMREIYYFPWTTFVLIVMMMMMNRHG